MPVVGSFDERGDGIVPAPQQPQQDVVVAVEDPRQVARAFAFAAYFCISAISPLFVKPG
jgi:hypothetical protein